MKLNNGLTHVQHCKFEQPTTKENPGTSYFPLFSKLSLLLISLFFFSLKGISQVAAWDFAGKTGNETTVTATTLSPNLNNTAVSRGAGINPVATGDTYASNGFTTGPTSLATAIANGDYIEFTINPKPGYMASLSTLDANFRRSGTGPNSFQWQYSLDGFATPGNNIGSSFTYSLSTSNGDPQTQIDLSSIPALQTFNNATTLSFRLYAWGATNSSGTFALGRPATPANDLAIGGTVSVMTVHNLTQLTDFSTIQAAINAANTNDIIQVDAGTYNEVLTISKTIHIRGAAYGISGTGVRPPESVLMAPLSGSSRLINLVGNVAPDFDGFHIDGKNVAAITQPGQSLTLRNNLVELDFTDNDNNLYFSSSQLILDRNYFKAIDGTNTTGASSHIFMSGGTFTCTNNTFTSADAIDNYTVSTTSLPVWLNITTGTTSAAVNNNSFSKVDIGILLASDAGGVIIENNDFDEAKRAAYTGGSSYGAGIALFNTLTPSSPDIIRNNSFKNSETGIRTSSTGAGQSFPAAGLLSVSFNSFTGISISAIRVSTDFSGSSTSLKATCNWYNSITGPVTGTNPGAAGMVITAPANTLAYANWLNYGTDANPAAPGFQLPAAVTAAPGSNVSVAQNHYRVLSNAIGCLVNNQTLTLSGTFNFGNPTAMAEWAKGNNQVAGDGMAVITGTGDDYTINAPDSVTGATITASSLGSAVIQGPGDLPAVALESAIYFNDKAAGSSFQNWTISNLVFRDFDASLVQDVNGGNTTAFNNFKITNNQFDIPEDLNASFGGETSNFQNIGINLGFGSGQEISGNTFNIDGTGVSDDGAGKYSSTVVLQTTTSGGAVYDGLKILNNTIHVNGDPDPVAPAVIRGFWENGHNTGSAIEISGNKFDNSSAGNTADLNRQTAFWVTSRSGGGKKVEYKNNEVSRYMEGVAWLGGLYTGYTAPDYESTASPVEVKNNKFDGMKNAVVVRKSVTSTNAGSPGYIEKNSFTNPVSGGLAIKNEGTGNAQSVCNWYNSTSFPVINTLNSGAVYIASVLDDGTDGSGATGFQPTGACIVPPVHNTTQDIYYTTIQSGVNAANNGDSITVASGTYNEKVVINKSVILRGVGATLPVINFTGTVTGRPALFDITADAVKIDSFHFSVDMSKFRSAILASAPAIDNVTIVNNLIDAYGTAAGSYGDRNAVSINYSGPSNYLVAAGGVNNVVFQHNTITGTGSNGFRSGVALDEGAGTFTGNTIQTISHDILVRFNNNGPVTISNNNLNGGGVELSDQNAASGTLTLSNNTFTPSGNDPAVGVLRIRNNYNAIPHLISNNTFNYNTWAISLENMNAVTLNGNTFTSSTAGAHAVVINTKSVSSNSSTIVQVPVGATIINNNFNGTGTALSFLNHDSDNDSYGTFTIGSPGNENNFAATLSSFISLDGQTGPSNGTVFPDYNTIIGTGATAITTRDYWATSLDASNNKFDVGAGLQLPAALSLTGLFSVEDKVQHKIDLAGLGFVTIKPTNAYVTLNSFAAPNTTPSVQRGIDAAATGFTVNIADGTYNEDILVNKSITLDGQSTAAIIRGLYAGATKTVTVSASNVTVKDLTITRDYGATLADWYAAGSKTEGIIAENVNNLTLDHIIVRDNRNGVYIHSVPGFVVKNSSIHDNRTGFQIWGNLDNGQVINNFINNNFTHGLLVNFDQGFTTGNNLLINNNDISGNWYSQINFQNNGAPGTNVGGFTGFNANCNWYGSLFPVFDASNPSAPGYGSQVPSQFAGTDPNVNSDIRGQEAALVNYQPFLQSNTDASPADGFQPAGDCLNAPTRLYVNDTYTGSDIYTTASGNDATGLGTPASPFASITRAVSGANAGDTIFVDGGTYRENLLINKVNLHLLGANTGINPNSGSRIAESIIQPAVNDLGREVITIAANAVRTQIDGFTVDGDNTVLGGGNASLGADINAGYAIVAEENISGDTLANNIIKNTGVMGIYLANNSGTATTGNLITANKFENILLSNGIGIYLGNNSYTNINNNVMTAVRIGIQTGNFYNADPGNSHGITANNIQSQVLGTWANLHYSNAANFVISNNNYSNYPGAPTLQSAGLRVQSIQGNVGVTVSNNNVTGNRYGAILMNDPTSNTITVQGGTLSGNTVGVWATNTINANNMNADPSQYIVDGVNIQNATLAGIEVNDTSATTNNSTVALSVRNGTIINNSTTGLLLQGGHASASFTGPAPASFTGQAKYIDQISNGTSVPAAGINATAVSFDGNTGGTMSLSQLYATEDKINHKIDNGALGFVLVKAGNAYVTPSSFLAPATTAARIQRGVDAASAGFTLNVQAGTYIDNISVNKSLTILGPNDGVDPCTGSRVAEAIVLPAAVALEPVTTGTIFRLGTGAGHIDVTIKGFTIDGSNPALGTGRLLNGVPVHTGAGIVNSIGSFDTNPGGYDVTMTVQNNIIQNLERYGVLADGLPSGAAMAGTDVSHNKIDNLPSGNLYGGGRGRGIAFEENHYGSATYNCISRVNVGWQDDNYYVASPGAGTVVANNTISSYHRGIFHNLQYQNASNATISNNTVSAESSNNSGTDFGVEIASIQSAVGATVSGNNVSGKKYGILLWNCPTSNTITVTGGTLTSNANGIYITNDDPQFGAADNSSYHINGVSVQGSTANGIWVNDNGSATVAAEITNTSIQGSPAAVGVLVKGTDASANIHNNGTLVTGTLTGVDLDGGFATLTQNRISGNGTGVSVRNSGQLGAVTQNFISNNTPGNGISIAATAGAIGAVNNNDLSGNAGLAISKAAAPTVNAECNWLGTTVPALVAAKVSANVDPIPWLTNGADNQPLVDGFQPAPGSCNGAGPIRNTRTNETYFTIQSGINDPLTINGDSLIVAAGTYAENLVVNKSLAIIGPNAGTSGCSSRVAEAVIVPGTADISSAEIIHVAASGVTIDGFTIDGDNPLINSGFSSTNGADIDAAEGITNYEAGVNNLVVKNNIIQHLSYFGVTLYGDGSGAPTSGSIITNNKIQNMGTYDNASGISLWGGGVLLYNNQYAAVTNNCMINTRIGVQTGNFYQANPGAGTFQSISGNTMSVRRRGIFHNLFYGAASAFTLSGNTISGVANAGETASWDGILLSSFNGVASTSNANNIDGSAITAIPATGISVWNDQTAPLITGGTINGVGLGINVNNYEGYPSTGSNAGNTSAVIDGVAVTGATIAAIRVNDNPLNSNNATVSAEIKNNSISGSALGILVTGSDASADIHDNTGVTGNTTGLEVNGGLVNPLYRNTISSNGTGLRVTNGGRLGLTTENFIKNNSAEAFHIDASAGTVGNINNNDLSGNTGLAINNLAAAAVNATCNWYGTADPDQVFAKLSTNVNYMPYLVNGTDNAPGTNGFQPAPGSCGGPGRYYVNDTNTGDDLYTTAVGNDANAGTAAAPFLTIQKALSVASEGDIIYVDGGIYTTQLDISKSVTIKGAGRAGASTTRIKAPAAPVAFTNPNGAYEAIIYAHGAGKTIHIDSLLVDGDNGRNVNKYTGVYFYEAGGSLTKCRVTGIRDVSFSGTQRGNAVYVNHAYDTDFGHTVTIDSNIIDDYQKTGLLINEINTHALIRGNTITGQAVKNVIAQNGIQIGYGAYATITGNTITGNLWNSADPHTYMSAAILLAGAGVDMSNAPTGNSTVIGGAGVLANSISGNESGIQTGDGGFGYVNSKNVTYAGDTYADNKVHVFLDPSDPVNVPAVTNNYDKRVDNPAQTNAVFGSIQYSIDFASATNSLNVSAGTFTENVVVHKPVSINGAGQTNTFVIPELSAPNTCGYGAGSLCPGASNIFLVRASDVHIQNLTADGNNPALTGIMAGGVDVDARNGIITDHTLSTVFNNLQVNDVTVKNIFLRGIYASTGGTFTFNNNTVTNVNGDPNGSIALFNFGGAGTFSGNNVSNALDGIVSNWSKGTVYSGNTVTNVAGVGIHTDNNGGSGGNADTIRNNTISNSPAGGYGIMVFAPYVPAQVYENTITNVEVGLTNAGQNAAVTPVFTRNVINGQSRANSVGVYQTTSLFGFGSSNVSGVFTNNYITNNAASGLYLETETGYSSDIVVNSNSITGNTLGVDTSGTGTATRNMTCNWWNVTGGNALVTAVGKATNYAPWLKSGLDAQPAQIGFQPGGVCGYDDNLYVNDGSGLGNFYTTATGSDSNPGVPAAPFRTIGKAIAVAQATGNTVWVDPGTYAENLVVNKELRFKGRKAGQNVTPRFSAFTGLKADPAVESIITAPVSDPLNSSNDLVKVFSSNTSFDGFVFDGNNPALAGASTVQDDGGLDIDARRVITNVSAGGTSTDISNLVIKNNIIQNVSQRGISLSSTGPVWSGTLIDSNLVRNYGWDPTNGGQAIILFTNAYADITHNSIIVPHDQIGLHLQNFYNNGTMTWSNNNVTVGQDAIGIHANLLYGSNSILNIQNNTVNAATGVTGASDFTWGINIWSVQNGATVNVAGNTVGSAGGEFARGINLWNLPTGNTVTVSAGTVARSVTGINLDNVDPYFGAGGNTLVNVINNPVITAASGQTGIRARSATVNAVAPAGTVTLNLNKATINASGTATGIAVEAPSSDPNNMATVYFAGGSVIGGGSNTPAFINGNQAQLYLTAGTITAPASGANNAIKFNGITTANIRENLVIGGGTVFNMNANPLARAFASPQYSIVEMDAAGGWTAPSALFGGTQTVMIDGRLKFSNGILSTAAVSDTIEFGNNAADIMTGTGKEKASSYILGNARMLSRPVHNGAVDMLGVRLAAEAGVAADLGNLVITRTTSASGSIDPSFPLDNSIRTVWNILPGNNAASRTDVQFRYLNTGSNINAQNPAAIYAYRNTGGTWTKISASLSSSLSGDIYTTSSFNAPGFSPWTLSSLSANSPDLTPSVFMDALSFTPLEVGVPRDFIVELDEVAGVPTSGVIQFRITKPAAFDITFNPSSGISNVFGGIPNSNSDFTVVDAGAFYLVTTNVPMGAYDFKIAGFKISRKPGIPANTTQNIGITIIPGSGGDNSNVNNLTSLQITAN